MLPSPRHDVWELDLQAGGMAEQEGPLAKYTHFVDEKTEDRRGPAAELTKTPSQGRFCYLRDLILPD
jgi:hypothetical protein